MIEKHLSVVGDPIEHSLSPLIHQVAYEYLGLEWQYDRNLVAKGHLVNFLEEHKQYSGLSVTMPLKEEAFEFAVTKTRTALDSRVVNTLCLIDGEWQGANTDIFGLKMCLARVEMNQIKNISLIGAGATARTALVVVSELFPNAAVTIYARDETQANSYLSYVHPGFNKNISEFSGNGDLVLNTTPVDFSHRGAGSKYWLNVNYSNALGVPPGAKGIDGVEMLIWQAIAQIRIFTQGDEKQTLAQEAQIVSKIRAALQLG